MRLRARGSAAAGPRSRRRAPSRMQTRARAASTVACFVRWSSTNSMTAFPPQASRLAQRAETPSYYISAAASLKLSLRQALHGTHALLVVQDRQILLHGGRGRRIVAHRLEKELHERPVRVAALTKAAPKLHLWLY